MPPNKILLRAVLGTTVVICSRAASFKRPLLSVDVSVCRQLWC